MPDLAELRVKSSDGTSIDLLSSNGGIHLLEWEPALASNGEGIESFTLVLNGNSPDAVARDLQDLRRLIKRADDYTTANWERDLVWIEARASCETNKRYCILRGGRIEGEANPFSSPFLGLNGMSTMDELILTVTRGDWTGYAPGSGVCAETLSLQEDWTQFSALAVRSADPANSLRLIQEENSNTYLFAIDGEAGTNVMRSVNRGVNWVTVQAFSVMADSLLMLDNDYVLCGGRILGGAYRVYRSTNRGGAFNIVDANFSSWFLCQLSNGNILSIADNGGSASQTIIRRSTDNGASWATIATIDGCYYYGIRSMLQAQNGDVLFTSYAAIYRSTDGGLTWTEETPFGLMDQVYPLWRDPETDYLYISVGNTASTQNYFLRSTDSGKNWSQILNLGANPKFEAYAREDYALWAANDTALWRSIDEGLTWISARTITDAVTYSIYWLVTEEMLIIGDTGNVYSFQYPTGFPVTLGMEGSCLSPDAYVVGHQKEANLTHIKIYDAAPGPTWTDIFPSAGLPDDLLPAVPAVGDMIYFGISTTDAFRSGPFCSLAFDLANQVAVNQTIVWEYMQAGPAWAALTVTDNTSSNPPTLANVLGKQGVNCVHWAQPTDWVTATIDGVTGYWVRARITVLPFAMDPPEQQNRNIYSLNRGYIQIDDVLGDIPSLLRIKLYNTSDLDGRGGSAPNLWANRGILGLRSVDRGADFSAYLNCSDRQWPPGLTFTAGSRGAFSSSSDCVTGRLYTLSMLLGDTTFSNQGTFSLIPGLAQQYYGEYHAFVRVQLASGSINEIFLRLVVASGSGGISQYSDEATIQSTSQFELVDLGRIAIPASDVYTSSDIGDTTTITVQVRNASGAARTVRVYDVILIPVDEWAVDAIDRVNSNNSVIGRPNLIGTFLDIDGLKHPKRSIRSVVRNVDFAEAMKSIYLPVSVSHPLLQANTSQRIWTLCPTTSATGSSYVWIAYPWTAHGVKLEYNPCYLGIRGDR